MVGKICHRALIAIRVELKRDTDSPCNCQNPINYDIPCCHQLSQCKDQLIDPCSISPRWSLSPGVLQGPSKFSPVKPWMKYIIALETTFRTLDDSSESIDELMESLDNIPEIKNALNTVEMNIGASVSLPKPADVRYLGRPPRLPRKLKIKCRPYVIQNKSNFH